MAAFKVHIFKEATW